MILKLLLSGFSYTSLVVMGRLCRPILLFFLTKQVDGSNKKMKTGRGSNEGIAMTKLLLFYNKKSQWSTVAPEISNLKNVKDQNLIIRSFVYLYLANHRFSELRECVAFWLYINSEWKLANKTAFHEALELHKKLYTWNLEVNDNEDSVSGQAALDIIRKITILNAGSVRDWRDARVTQHMLKWSLEEEDEPLRIAVEIMELDTSPVFFKQINFDYEFAASMGMGDEVFHQICLEAENVTH